MPFKPLKLEQILLCTVSNDANFRAIPVVPIPHKPRLKTFLHASDEMWKFLKLKMADGRRFKNCISAVTQQAIVRF